MTGENLKRLSWPGVIIFLACAGPYSTAAAGDGLLPPEEQNFDEIILSMKQFMLQEGFRPIVTADRELYSLVSKIARSKEQLFRMTMRLNFMNRLINIGWC
ncbi:MAG: hypothetical protein AB7F74_10290 [Parvibaculaceae bacterium]